MGRGGSVGRGQFYLILPTLPTPPTPPTLPHSLHTPLLLRLFRFMSANPIYKSRARDRLPYIAFLKLM
ncbi:MAG: hypothetical protein F6J93_08845 [Oscillatoria sp. SIO1A7]|nr:hypothetical protein [Oscillatoria sp. SIO1A7]